MEPTGLRKAVRATVRGRVQGVGFRYRTVWVADAQHITGWVRNEDDGTVQIHAEGSPHRVEQFLQIIRGGFPGVTVTRVDTTTAKAENFTDFRIKQ